MSTINSTFSSSKFKSFFLGFSYFISGDLLKSSLNKLYQVRFLVWPEGISYLAWQNILKRIPKSKGKGNGNRNSKKKKRPPSRQKILSRAIAKQENQIVKREIDAIAKLVEPSSQAQKGATNNLKNENVNLELITMLKKFWEAKHCNELIGETIPDHRNQELITYSKESIIMSALSIFLFRIGSGNKYNDLTNDEDEKYSKANMSSFIDSPEGRVPVIKTIENFLKELQESSINDLMIAFFKDLQRSKFFKHHPELKPTESFLLAADCVHTHTYDHPHKKDSDENNTCECCLKRVYNKGMKNEKVKWIHSTLVFCFIFAGGLKIPIYRYPIHSKQVVDLESASEDAHKQECELVALKMALPTIRLAFPKMKLILLLDGLYANRPVIRLANENRCGYIIVKKDGCLTTLGKECDEHAETPNHKKNCRKKKKLTSDTEWTFELEYQWFNNSYLGEGVKTNVLRFSEKRTKEGEKDQSYYCEWLFSWSLSRHSCELGARIARSRWEIEDLFNTLKNRGFNLKHDYSRDPCSCFNWQGLALFAFGFFELFRFTEAVKKRGTWSQIALADKLKGQLLQRPTEEIFSEQCMLKSIQFRYHFVIKRLEECKEITSEVCEELFNTG